jgi:hypothetical protein
MHVVGGIAMREKVPIDTDELEDESELLDEELKHQIAEGYEAYLRGDSKDLETLIAELRNESNPQKTEGQ